MNTKTFSLNMEIISKENKQWVELIPAGSEVVGRDGRDWINDNPQGIIDAFDANKADLPLDLEHSTELKAPNGEPAPAVGWIKSLEIREGESIWGLVHWNNEGHRLMEDKAYKYLSPVFTFDTKTKRILQLYSAGLTNQPNLHLTALNQRISLTGEGNNMSVSLTVCRALELPADSTESQILSAINQLREDKDKALNIANNPSLERFVPRADHNAALNRAQEAEIKLKEIEDIALNQKIEDELEKAQRIGAITPATVAYHRSCCKQEGGFKRFQEFVQVAPKIGEDSGIDNKTHNSHNKELNEQEKVACNMFGIQEAQFIKMKESV